MKVLRTVRWSAVLLGAGIGIVTMVISCAGAAALMARGIVETGSMGLFAAGILILSGLAGGMTALLGGGSAADAALAALGELVVLFGLNAVLSGGQMEGIGVTVLALAGGSGAAVLTRMGRGERHRRKRRRR